MYFKNMKNIKRINSDIMEILMSDYKVEKDDSKLDTFYIYLDGPKNSLYEEGRWKLCIFLPDDYPYKSPSICFKNRIYHPNIDYFSGVVCLDVINQTWTPMYRLLNIFDVFLPQLLLYPNETDPLNPEAAQDIINNKERYNNKVKENIEKWARKEDYGLSDEEDEEMSLSTLS